MTEKHLARLLVREFVLHPELVEEFDLENHLSSLDLSTEELLLSQPERVEISPEVAEALTELLSKRWRRKPLYLLKTTARLLEDADTDEAKYLRFCHSALCHGILGDADHAEKCLLEAAAIDDQRPLHHHIYALIHGLRGEAEKALFELHLAIERQPGEENLPRIYFTQQHFTEALSN